MAQAPARRSAPARGAAPAARTAPRTAGRSQYRGEEGMRRASEEIEKSKEKERQRRERGHAPMRFRMQAGETKQAVILDDKPDFFQYEHNAKDAEGKWSIFSGCVKQEDNCPACAALGKESYYAMYLTVLDLTPFELRSGETVEFSRKLLVVKNQQQKKFMRMYEKEGTLRGMILDFTRDGDKEPAIGNDIEFVEWMPEDELATYVREWTDREKKRHVEDCSEVYDYEKLFPEPTTEGLRAQFGGSAPPGSRAAEEAELGGGPRRPPRRGAPTADDDWDRPEADAQYGDDDAAPAPRRGARAAAPVRGRRGAAAPEAEAEAEAGERELRYAPEDIDPQSGLPYEDAVPLPDDDVDDTPPPARGRRAPPPAAAAPRRGRSAPVEDADPDAEDTPPPRRGAPAAAPRRGAAAPAPRRGAAPADDNSGAARRVSFRRTRPE